MFMIIRDFGVECLKYTKVRSAALDRSPHKKQMPSRPLYVIVVCYMSEKAKQEHHPTSADERPHRNRRESLRSILSTVAVLLIAPLIAISLTKFVFQPYQVDGQSMETTLSHNDRLIVWKLAKTWSRVTNHPYLPKRGDVIVFAAPALPQFGNEPGKQLIKRVVAMPGERVVVSDGVLTVFSDQYPDGFVPDDTLPYGKNIETTTLDGEWEVGKNQIFVVGDNRGNSTDSRVFGPIDLDSVIGKLIIRVLPVDKMSKF